MIQKVTSHYKGKVLVVEDYNLNRELIQEMLGLFHCNVEIAIDGEEAVNLCKNTHFDLILMDIQMPKMGGIEAMKCIRKLDNDNKDVPIIALTANALQGDKEQYLAEGMNDFISKPLKMVELERVLGLFLPKEA